MSLYTLPNSTGMDSILVDTVAAAPSLTPLILVFTYLVVLLGGMGRSKARTGETEFWMWTTVASLCSFMIALIMSMKSGIIQLEWLIIVLVFAIFSGVGLFLNKRSGEV